MPETRQQRLDDTVQAHFRAGPGEPPPHQTSATAPAQRLRRRSFLGGAAAGLVASELPILASAMGAEVSSTPRLRSLGPVKQIKAGVLDVGYVELGPIDGPPVLLLHGWPYDIHSYVDVAPALAGRGCRVVVPHLRGHGSTRILEGSNPRSGQQAALGVDVVDLLNAFGIERAVLAGYDWGGRAACVARVVASTMRRACVREQLSDSEHCCCQRPARREDRGRLLVSVLFPHGTRASGPHVESTRHRPDHVGTQSANLAIRRRNVQSQCDCIRQIGSCPCPWCRSTARRRLRCTGTQRATAGSRVGAVSLSVCSPSSCM